MSEADGYRALAIASYAGSLHGRRLLGGMAVLNALHRPAELDDAAAGDAVALRCPTCRDSHGRRAPWPCRTFVEMLRGLGCDPGPAGRLAQAQGIRLPPALDGEALVHAERDRSHRS